MPSVSVSSLYKFVILSEDMRACLSTLSHLEAFVEFNRLNIINAIVKGLPPLLQARLYALVFKTLKRHANRKKYEWTEFNAMKSRATTLGLDYILNIEKGKGVATERHFLPKNLPITHPMSILRLNNSSSATMQPRSTQTNSSR